MDEDESVGKCVNIVKPKHRCEGNELLTLNVGFKAQTSSTKIST